MCACFRRVKICWAENSKQQTIDCVPCPTHIWLPNGGLEWVGKRVRKAERFTLGSQALKLFAFVCD